MNQISIFVLADQAIAREGLQAILQFDFNVNVIGHAETVEEATAWLARMPADAVLIDMLLPICALDAARTVLRSAPSAHVLVLSAYVDDTRVASVIRAELQQAGVSALLSKNSSASELVDAIQRVMTGEPIFPAGISSTIELMPPLGRAHDAVQPSLTLRQTQVLRLVAEGFANKEIADRLRISPKTVEKHRQSVKEKLHTNNAADLARRAIGLGLVQAV
jgi:DNA-binding NarL/FixJ family response regulator